MWPISTRVNRPENDNPSILDRGTEPVDWQAPLEQADPWGGLRRVSIPAERLLTPASEAPADQLRPRRRVR